MTFLARMAFILNLQRQYLAFKYTPLSNAGMGGGSLLFKYHYNTKLKDGNYSIPTKETSRRRPLATALGSLKLFLSKELSFITGRNAKWYSQLWKTVWQFLAKLNIIFTIQSANCGPWYLLKRVKNISIQKPGHRCL